MEGNTLPTYTISIVPHGGRTESIERHCPNCGRVVPFTFSGRTRTNANGKKLHVYAIYKCPRDHTWNRRVEKGAPPPEAKRDAGAPPRLSIQDLLAQGFDRIELQIRDGGGARLDRLLSSILAGVGRERARSWIAAGLVLVEGRRARPDRRLKGKAVVQVLLAR